MNIIADVAGQYDALRALLEQMPRVGFLCVGDLIDRGPRSKDVIDFVRAHGRALMGNHEHMMLDRLNGTRLYWDGCWIKNGGEHTLQSYPNRLVSKDHLDWLGQLPLYYRGDGFIVTHAPISAGLTVDRAIQLNPDDQMGILWNRSEPTERPGLFQVFGHNSHWGLKWFGGPPEQAWAVCLDASESKLLTGINLPSRKIYQVPYRVQRQTP